MVPHMLKTTENKIIDLLSILRAEKCFTSEICLPVSSLACWEKICSDEIIV